MKSTSVKSISQQAKRFRKDERVPDHVDNEWYEGFMKAVRELRKDYDPGYCEFVRSLRDTDFYSGQPLSGKPK